MIIMCAIVGKDASKMKDAITKVNEYFNINYGNDVLRVYITNNEEILSNDVEGIRFRKVKVSNGEEFQWKCLERIRIEKMRCEDKINMLFDVCFFINSDKLDLNDLPSANAVPLDKQIVTINNTIQYVEPQCEYVVGISPYFWFSKSIEFNMISSYYKLPIPSGKPSLFYDIHNNRSTLLHYKDDFINNKFFIHVKILGLTNVEI